MSQRHLVPCPACNRQVFSDACACPFCEAALNAHACASLTAPHARRDRLGRAATMAAAATLLGATACGGFAAYGVNIPWDAGVDSGAADQAVDSATDGTDDAADAAAAAPTNPAGGGPRSDGG